MARDRASRLGWKLIRASGYLPKIGRGWNGWVAGRNTPQKLVWRARIVLMWAEGGRRDGGRSGDRQDQANRLSLVRPLSRVRRLGARTRRHASRTASRLWTRRRSSGLSR